MSERFPRRANQLLLDAEQLDNNASKARSLNKRARNRLLLAKDSLDGQKHTNMNSLRHEMKQLRHQLRDVKQSSGYITLRQGQIISPAKRKATKEAKTRLKGSQRKKPNTNLGLDEKQDVFNQIEEQNQSLPTLQSYAARESQTLKPKKDIVLTSLSGKDTDCEIPTEYNRKANLKYTDSHANSRWCTKVESELTAVQNYRTNTDSQVRSLRPEVTVNVPFESMEIDKKDKPDNTNSRQKSRRISKSENSLSNLNVDAVKDRIQNRLSGSSAVTVSQPGQDQMDASAFLYAPPDGLPRTVYLLPTLEELFNEAKKARYIRKPRKPKEERTRDDPERELGIDEIFGKAKI